MNAEVRKLDMFEASRLWVETLCWVNCKELISTSRPGDQIFLTDPTKYLSPSSHPRMGFDPVCQHVFV
jgi:hypothetical protein